MKGLTTSNSQLMNQTYGYCHICKKYQETQLAIDSNTHNPYSICSVCNNIVIRNIICKKVFPTYHQVNNQPVSPQENKKEIKKREKDKLKELQEGIIPNNQWVNNSNSKQKKSINIPIAKFVYHRLYSPSTVSPSQH